MSTNQNYIHWHTAFQAAAELELRENIEELTFEPEHYLSKEPLRIDLLILHLKNPATHLHNEIGKIMRKHNIIEYKGPGDQLSIDTLYKVLGYACLYKSFGDTIDAISTHDITVSLFREAYPRELFKKLKEDTQSHEITEEYPGIYYISGFLFPLQIVVLRRLSCNISFGILADITTESSLYLFASILKTFSVMFITLFQNVYFMALLFCLHILFCPPVERCPADMIPLQNIIHRQFSLFPCIYNIHKIIRKYDFRSAKLHAPHFCCCNPFRLPFPYICSLIFRNEREYLQYQLCNKCSHQIFLVSRI